MRFPGRLFGFPEHDRTRRTRSFKSLSVDEQNTLPARVLLSVPGGTVGLGVLTNLVIKDSYNGVRFY